jgi:hypothetical protein
MWTQSANVSGYAITDGFLKFAGPTALADKDAQLEEAMDKETLKLFRLLAERWSSLVTHKFKNLAADGPEVMLAIPNFSHSPRFDWTSCSIPECASMTKHERERHKVGAVIVGHDANNTPWTLPQLKIALASASAQLPDSVPPPALSTGSPNVQSSPKDAGTSKTVKRKRDDDSSNQSRASS